MIRIIFGIILLPLAVWLGTVFLLGTFLPQAYKPLLAGSFLCTLTLIAVWWSLLVARWTRRKVRFESIGYLIANLCISLAIIGFSLSVVVSLPQKLNILAVFIFLISCLFSLGWLVGSVVSLIRNRKNSQYDTVFWWSLESNSFVWLSHGQKQTNQQNQIEKFEEHLVSTSQTTTKPQPTLFTRVSTTKAENVPNDAVLIPPRILNNHSTRQAPPPVSETPLPKVLAPNGDSLPSFTISISVNSPYTNFLQSARKFAARTERKADPVPFMAYWPTYSDMSDAQQKWYFYWRTELRNGRFLPADTSYLFLHVYEVINLVGLQTPQAALDHLIKFWKFYRILQPKLDNYLVDWIADFLVVHKLPLQPLAWYGQAVQLGAYSGDQNLLFEAWLALGSDFSSLPMPLMYRIAGFSPKQSKFYQVHNPAKNLDNAYKKGIQAINDYLLQTRNNSLFEIYVDNKAKMVERLPFASAPHQYTEQKISLAKARSWLNSNTLADHLKSVIKQTENILREQEKFGSKLRGINLPEQWKGAIEKAFTPTAPLPKIEINLASVEALQRESEEVRQRLIVEEEPGTVFTHIKEVSNSYRQIHDELDITLSSFTIRPPDAPDGLLTDLVEVAKVMGEATGEAATVLKTLRDKGWQATSKVLETEIQSSFLNAIIDQINDRAFTELGDNLIFSEEPLWVVAEDYRDEISHILEHPDYFNKAHHSIAENPLSTNSVESNAYDDLPEEWAKFTQQMQTHHWNSLATLIDHDDVKMRLDIIARSVNLTANQIIDDINEFALESINDIVIDTTGEIPQLEDENRENMKELLKWATSKALVKVLT